MNSNWINIMIAIIQVITMFAIGSWQIKVAKNIAKNDAGKPINIKNWFRSFLSKHSSKISNVIILFNILTVSSFILLKKDISRAEILYIVFVSGATVLVMVMNLFTSLLVAISKNNEFLYCMICKHSSLKKPV